MHVLDDHLEGGVCNRIHQCALDKVRYLSRCHHASTSRNLSNLHPGVNGQLVVYLRGVLSKALEAIRALQLFQHRDLKVTRPPRLIPGRSQMSPS